MLKDPYADALGGCPPGLFPVIARELENLNKYNIHPVFVFDGMVPPLHHELFNNNNGQPEKLDLAWSSLAMKDETVSLLYTFNRILLGGPEGIRSCHFED